MKRTLIVAVAAALGWRSLRPAATDLSRYRFTPLATEPGYEGSPAWSPDGRTVAYIGEKDGVLQVYTRALGSSMAAQITHAMRDCKAQSQGDNRTW